MISFLLKLLLLPGVIFLADSLSPAINYATGWQVISVGVFLAIVSYMMDALLLRNVGSGVSAVIDFVTAAVVIYLSQFVLAGAYATFLGTLFAAAFLALSEYLTHRLIVSEKLAEGRHRT
ncbi:MAG: YndM family protein [Clostridia bacterium]|nr:YndM family protein [Clostridia bacterium]